MWACMVLGGEGQSASREVGTQRSWKQSEEARPGGRAPEAEGRVRWVEPAGRGRARMEQRAPSTLQCDKVEHPGPSARCEERGHPGGGRRRAGSSVSELSDHGRGCLRRQPLKARDASGCLQGVV